MATLEKIRSRQKLLFTIILGALILFIISIADANQIRNLFGPGTTIAEVGGVKVDYNDYRNLVDQQNQQNQNQNQDRELTSQAAIQQLLFQQLMDEQYDQLGINITDAEITRAMTGEMPHPAAARFIQGVSQALGLPTANGSTLLDAINNPGRYNLNPDQLNAMAQQYFGVPTMADAWRAQEKEVENQIRQEAFGKLMAGLFTANQLDAKALYEDNNTQSKLSLVSSPFSSVNDKDVQVSDVDIKAKWEELKPMYKIAEETREIDYIAVPIVPSKDDFAAAEVEVDKVTTALMNQTEGQAATIPSNFMHDNKVMPVSQAKKDADLRLIPDSVMHKGGVYKYPKANTLFRIAKVNDITTQIDSINVSMFFAQDKAQADSIVTLIQNGKTFKALAEEFQGQARDSVWSSLVGAPANIAKSLENATVGQAFAFNDSVQGGNAVYLVNKRNAPVQIADITLYSYTLDPSFNTTNDIKSKLSAFLASNNKADKFAENADTLYQLRHDRISASTPKLGYMPSQRGMPSGLSDSRHAINWAMNAKKGEVSPIFTDNKDYYVVVALKDIYEDQYIPYTSPQVKEELTQLVMADKKGDVLVDKYKGKAQDIQGYAKLMGTEVVTDSTFVFSAPMMASLPGNQYVVQGQVAAAKPGTLVGPFKGANEVVVFVVNSTDKTARPYNYEQDAQTFMQAFGMKDPFSLLAGKRKVKNHSLKFENYDNAR